MMGASHLKCMQDGTWNGTAPLCLLLIISASNSQLSSFRQCIYDPQEDGRDYWLSGAEVDCPLVDCGPPPSLAGAFYDGDDYSHKVFSYVLCSHCRCLILK
uniref:Sushi domain-containing protein n=1 Tax=Parascaris equorum TaxID=6256 RepID=A0A914RZD3_PAREQ